MEFTPAEAAEGLEAVRGFHQEATTRAASITWMVWGLAFPLAAASMSLGGGLETEMGPPLRFSFQWGWGMAAPMLIMGWSAVVTGFVWHAFAIDPKTRIRPAASLAVTGVLLPVAIAVVWFTAFVLFVVRGSGDLEPGAHWQAVERAFVFHPSPLVVAGVWAFAASFGPWLGPRQGLTRLVGAGAVGLGLGINALRLVEVWPSEAIRTGLVAVVFGATGAFLYLRG